MVLLLYQSLSEARRFASHSLSSSGALYLAEDSAGMAFGCAQMACTSKLMAVKDLVVRFLGLPAHDCAGPCQWLSAPWSLHAGDWAKRRASVDRNEILQLGGVLIYCSSQVMAGFVAAKQMRDV